MTRKTSILLPFGLFFLLLIPYLMPINYLSDLVYIDTKGETTSGVSNGHAMINMTYPSPGYQSAVALVQCDDGGFIIGGNNGNDANDGSGVLTNTTLLNGTCFLHITVEDTVGNVLHANMRIVAIKKTLPVVITSTPVAPPPFPKFLQPIQLFLVFLAAALIIILLFLCTKAIETKNHMR